MLTDSLGFDVRTIGLPDFGPYKPRTAQAAIAWGTGDKLLDTMRLAGDLSANDAALTACSPTMSTAELTRIRNNVIAQYNALRNNYTNVGGSLDSDAVVAQYETFFAATEGGDYCHYTSDAQLVRDIRAAIQGANQVLTSAYNQYAANFANRMVTVRNAHLQLQGAVANAALSVDPVLNAYKALLAANFPWKLHSGLNGTLDGLISEYELIFNGSDALFEQGIARVQGGFEAAYRQANLVFAGFARAYDHWDKTDGAAGYDIYVANITAYAAELARVSQYSVVDNPLNRQISAESQLHIAEVKTQFAKFPDFVAAQPTTGFALDATTPAKKFFARQLTLNLAQAAGAHFNAQIAPGQSLIGTGFSYQHGGKMPPHSEHKDGRDCDIFSVYFKVGGAGYDEDRAIAMATWLLQAGVSRLIYTNSAVVTAANAAVPGNAVAVTGSGHDTHMHFDVELAT